MVGIGKLYQPLKKSNNTNYGKKAINKKENPSDGGSALKVDALRGFY